MQIDLSSCLMQGIHYANKQFNARESLEKFKTEETVDPYKNLHQFCIRIKLLLKMFDAPILIKELLIKVILVTN